MVVLAHLDRQSNSLFWPMIHRHGKPCTENTHSHTNAIGARRTETRHQEVSRRICRACERSVTCPRLSLGKAETAVSAAGTGRAPVTTTSHTALGGAHARACR